MSSFVNNDKLNGWGVKGIQKMFRRLVSLLSSTRHEQCCTETITICSLAILKKKLMSSLPLFGFYVHTVYFRHCKLIVLTLDCGKNKYHKDGAWSTHLIRKKFTRIRCKKCGVALCIVPCFEKYCTLQCVLHVIIKNIV